MEVEVGVGIGCGGWGSSSTIKIEKGAIYSMSEKLKPKQTNLFLHHIDSFM
jgi:hypothetical protein